MSGAGDGETTEEGASSGFFWQPENNTIPKPTIIKLNQKTFFTGFPSS
jgi:hypothetical protein